MEIVHGNLYDYPKYYDAVFASDWKAEFDFLLACFEKHARRPVRRVFEPACGTGRLLVKLAQAGYDVSGLDLNPKAVAFCNRRLEKHGFPPTATVGDITDFRLRRKADAAMNPINSFRHLPSEEAAEAHLRAMAGALVRGGLYMLGLHLTPTVGQAMEEESWSARRGNLAVLSRMWRKTLDLRRRVETVGMTIDIYTPSRSWRLVDEIDFRTYTARQMQTLIERVGEFDIAAVYDFSYDIDHPVEIGPESEDVVYILRKR